MPKRATQVILTEKEQEELVQITKRHRSEQQQVLRARIVLAAAQGHSNTQIAYELAVNVDTARLWRDRWVAFQGIDLDTLRIAERLQDAPRPGAPARITSDKQREEKIVEGCQVYARAAHRAKQGERTISIDELTAVQALERKYPDLPMLPGHVLRREFEYMRHGTLSWANQLRCRNWACDRSLVGSDSQRGGCIGSFSTPDCQRSFRNQVASRGR